MHMHIPGEPKVRYNFKKGTNYDKEVRFAKKGLTRKSDFFSSEKKLFKKSPVEGADDPKHNIEDSSTFH